MAICRAQGRERRPPGCSGSPHRPSGARLAQGRALFEPPQGTPARLVQPAGSSHPFAARSRANFGAQARPDLSGYWPKILLLESNRAYRVALRSYRASLPPIQKIGVCFSLPPPKPATRSPSPQTQPAQNRWSRAVYLQPTPALPASGRMGPCAHPATAQRVGHGRCSEVTVASHSSSQPIEMPCETGRN